MSAVLIVLKKELREMIRDKRVRSAMFIGPVFSIALTMMMFGLIFASVKKATKTTIHVIGAKQDEGTKAFMKALEKGGMTFEKVATKADAEKKIKDGDMRLALDFGAGVEKDKPVNIGAYFDPSDQKAQIALSVVEKVGETVSAEMVKQVYIKQGLDPELSKLVRVKRNEVKVGETKGNDILVQMLPYLIVIWAFYGAFSPASDTVSGEKERQTLETLLISPVPRNQIAFGKLLALATASMCSVLVALSTIMFFYLLKLDILKVIFENGLGLNATGFLVILITMIPTVAFFSSVLLAISSFARNTREAQTYLAQASIFVMMPAVFSQIIGFTEFGQSRAVYAIPILNSANVIRNALSGKYDPVGITMTVAIGLILAGIAIAYSIKLFNRESILNRV
jgi:sodium transport system permease protein